MPDPTDPRRRAPEHLVAMIAALGGPPRRGMGREEGEQAWAAQVRRVADHVWFEGYMAGATFATSIAPPAPIVVDLAGADAEQLRAAIATAAADYQRVTGAPATVVDLPGWVWDQYGANRVFALARSVNLRARRQPDQYDPQGQLAHCPT